MNVALLENLCQERGEKITNVIKKLSLAKGSISNWRNGAIPNGETLIKLAQYFNVSTDYLLGLSEQKQNDVKNEKENKEMNKPNIKLFNKYSEKEIWEAICKEWQVDNQQDLVRQFSMDLQYFSKIVNSNFEVLNQKEQESQKKLEKLLDLKLPRNEFHKSLINIELKKDTLTRFISQKTNNLEQSSVENLASELNLSPISIISWGIGERKPNKLSLDSLIIHFNPSDYLIKEFLELIGGTPTEEISEIEEIDA